MPTNKEQIETILRSIKKKQAGIKVQTSVFLKKIQEMLFPQEGQPAQLTLDEANLLLKGIEAEKVEGLIQLCGNETFGSLKKSAFYAVQILYRCLIETKNKGDFLKIFYELDGDEFKTMRLASHISQKKTDTALKLCGIIREKRCHLNIGQYIYSEQSQKTFQAWYKKYESKKKQQEKKNLQWNENQMVAPSTLIVQNLKQAPMKSTPKTSKNAAKAKSKKQLQTIQFFEEYIGDEDSNDYYLDTYVDPIYLVLAARGEEIDGVKRIRLQNHRIVSYLIMIPSRIIDLEQVKDVVRQVHIQSPQFDPKTLIKHFHSDATKQQLAQYAKVLSHNIFEPKYCRETFHTFNFPKECEMEILFRNMYAFFGKAESVTEKASVGFELRTKIKTSISKLAESTNPVLERFNEGEKIRKIILFLENNKQFTKLPQKFKQLQDEKDYRGICHLFKKYIRLMRNYNTHPILKKLIQGINYQLGLLRRRKLKDVYKAMEEDNQFLNEITILAQLFEQNVIEDYLIDRLLNQFVRYIQEQSARLRPENVNVMANLMTKKDLTFFGAIVTLNEHQSVNDGDLINEYFKEKNTIRQKLSGKVDLNQQLSKVNELEVKIKQFMSLSDKIQSGELDTFILRPKPQNVRKKTNKNNKNFLASTMVEWYKLMFQYMINQKSLEDRISHVTQLGKMVNVINTFQIKQYKALEEENMKYYIELMKQQLREKLKTKSCLIKQDFNKNYYNSNLIDNLNLLIVRLEVISKYPLFSAKYIEPLILPFILSILTRPDSKDKKELLTYSALCKCVNVGRIIIPHMLKIKSLLGYDDRVEDIFRDMLNNDSQKNMKDAFVIYSTIISKEYKETLSQFKGMEFAAEVLDLVVENIFQVVEHSNNLYNQFKTLIIQNLANDLAYFKNNDPPADMKKFYIEVQLIQMMCNRIMTKRGKTKLAEVLAKSVEYTEQEKKQKENYLLKTRHKYQYRYQSILDY